MIKLEEKNNVTPICPYCEAELSTVSYRKMESSFGKRYIYFCPKCKKVLGASHRKGFWMG